MIPDELVRSLAGAARVALFTHYNPDGDAYGSLFGLARVLRGLGKEVFCYLEEPITHLYEFLPGQEGVGGLAAYTSFIAEPEGLVSVALDCGDADRLGENQAIFLAHAPFLVLDHHRGHRDFGTLRWVDQNRSSTGEMVYELALALGAEVDLVAATNLYVAICTDTGSFRYESTGARTMEITAELLKKGVRPEAVGSQLYDNFTPERLALLRLALGSITLHAGDQVALMEVTQEMLRESGASLADLDGCIDFARALKTVKVAALLKELESGVAVSLRAKGECDVAAVAASFAGGGHRNAAGFRCPGQSLKETREKTLKALVQALTA